MALAEHQGQWQGSSAAVSFIPASTRPWSAPKASGVLYAVSEALPVADNVNAPTGDSSASLMTLLF